MLENTGGEKVPYRAGQFLTFIFERHGREVRRSFSLSSAPGIDNDLSVTVKRLENGEFSRYMLSELRQGDILKSLYPAGRFTFDESFRGPGDIFLLAAGSGIVPIFSILKTLLKNRPDLKITLLYSNYTEESIIFRDAIENAERAHSLQFRCIHILSHPERPAGSGKLAGKTVHGHLNNHRLERLVERYLHFEKKRARFFICGPFAYMRMAQITLRAARFGEGQLHKENFVVKEPLPPQFVFPGGTYPKEVSLLWKGRTSTLSVPRGRTILDAALDAGIELPYSCKAGVCATCTSRCTTGKVKLAVNEVLTDADLEQGLVLTCVGYPVTEKVRIEIEI